MRVFTIILLLSPYLLQAQYFEKQEIFSGDYLECYDFDVYNGEFYFIGEAEGVSAGIYHTNGEVGNGGLVRNSEGEVLNGNSVLGDFQNRMYFYANIEGEARGVWYTDGTPNGAIKLSEINPLPDGDTFSFFMEEIDGAIIFQANDGVNGTELWKSDGSAQGTVLLKDINPNGNGVVTGIRKHNGIIYFIGDDGVHGAELWRTDGTEDGTYMVKDINLEGNGCLGNNSIVFNDDIYFIGQSAEYGRELWRTDGTEGGTVQVSDINEGVESGLFFSVELVVLGDRLVFNAVTEETGFELWTTDGSDEGTELLIDLAPGELASSPSDLMLFNGLIYFGANGTADNSAPKRLWSTDGTAEGTQQVAALADIENPRDMAALENEFCFTSDGDGFADLFWSSDGSDEGTQMIAPEGVEGEWEVQNYGDMFVFGPRIYFEAQVDGVSDLWSYGLSPVSNLDPIRSRQSELELFPNPTQSLTRLNAPNPMQELSIWNALGQRVASVPLNGATSYELDTSILPGKGLFFLEITMEGSRSVKKLLVE